MLSVSYLDENSFAIIQLETLRHWHKSIQTVCPTNLRYLNTTLYRIMQERRSLLFVVDPRVPDWLRMHEAGTFSFV